MRARGALGALIATTTVWSCSGEPGTIGSSSPPIAPPRAVPLRDVEVPGLPSPYYHFEYDADGRIRVATFASGLRTYDVTYDGDRIAEQAGRRGNRDRLVYRYDDSGRAVSVRYLDPGAQLYAVVLLSYAGPRLARLERDRKVAAGFVVEKTMSFAYDPDGNVREIVEQHPAVDGETPATTTIDRFEAYDDGTNVDGFDLLHSEFADHLVLVPQVRLQHGNPRRVTHTGDGINYTVDYAYTYDACGRPLEKRGTVTFLTGSAAGSRAETLARFSYY